MARIPKCEYKLLTEEDLEQLYREKPKLISETFEGYCIQTEKRLLFGPLAQEEDQCLSCFPNSHFVVVPLKYLEKTPERPKPILRSISSIRAMYHNVEV